MRRTICFALFGLLVSNGAAFPQARAGPGPLVRPRGRVIVVRRFAARPRVFLRYGILAPFPYPVWNYHRAIANVRVHRAIANVRVRRRRLGEPPAVGVQGRHDVHGDGLLARRRSAPLHYDRRRRNEVRAAHCAVRGPRCATDNRRRCSAGVSVPGKRRTDRAMAPAPRAAHAWAAREQRGRRHS